MYTATRIRPVLLHLGQSRLVQSLYANALWSLNYRLNGKLRPYSKTSAESKKTDLQAEHLRAKCLTLSITQHSEFTSLSPSAKMVFYIPLSSVKIPNSRKSTNFV